MSLFSIVAWRPPDVESYRSLYVHGQHDRMRADCGRETRVARTNNRLKTTSCATRRLFKPRILGPQGEPEIFGLPGGKARASRCLKLRQLSFRENGEGSACYVCASKPIFIKI